MNRMIQAIVFLLLCLATTAVYCYHTATLLRTENAQLRTENEHLQWVITSSQDAQCETLLDGIENRIWDYENCTNEDNYYCLNRFFDQSDDLVALVPHLPIANSTIAPLISMNTGMVIPPELLFFPYTNGPETPTTYSLPELINAIPAWCPTIDPVGTEKLVKTLRKITALPPPP